MNTIRQQTMGILMVILAFGMQAGFADNRPGIVEVPQTTDLSALATQAQTKNLPVLLVFSAQHCAYCVLLEEEILKPMLVSGDYRDRVLIYKVMIDESSDLLDFNGKSINAALLAQRYNVYVTPTMLFLDPAGQELSERILGINTIEMFGGLVDQAIEMSLKQLRHGGQNLASNSSGVRP